MEFVIVLIFSITAAYMFLAGEEIPDLLAYIVAGFVGYFFNSRTDGKADS